MKQIKTVGGEKEVLCRNNSGEIEAKGILTRFPTVFDCLGLETSCFEI